MVVSTQACSIQWGPIQLRLVTQCIDMLCATVNLSHLQAQPSLQELFQLLPVTWSLLQHTKASSSQDRQIQTGDFLDLTEDDPEHDEHAEETSNLLWLSTALEWGPLCTAASVMYWAEAIQKVLLLLKSLCPAR